MINCISLGPRIQNCPCWDIGLYCNCMHRYIIYLDRPYAILLHRRDRHCNSHLGSCNYDVKSIMTSQNSSNVLKARLHRMATVVRPLCVLKNGQDAERRRPLCVHSAMRLPPRRSLCVHGVLSASFLGPLSDLGDHAASHERQNGRRPV